MGLSEVQRIFHGFEHAGLRLELDPARSINERIAACKVIDVETGESVGDVLRWVEKSDPTVLRGEGQFLLPRYRRRGFTKALHVHTVAGCREIGIAVLTGLIAYDGSAVWARIGGDFNLDEYEGPDGRTRRARAVATIFAPDAERRRRWRRIPRIMGPNPRGVLRARRRRGGASARAARAMEARIPTEEQIASGDLDGTFQTPNEIVTFEAHGIQIGNEAMLRAVWEGRLFIEDLE